MNFEELAKATLAVVGCVQGLYMRFLEENNNDKEMALRLTQIAWYGIMRTAKQEGDE